jgi:hypothetical protein
MLKKKEEEEEKKPKNGAVWNDIVDSSSFSVFPLDV